MNITPRPYKGLKDFITMTSILAIGRKTDTSTYYVHTGDLSWWMFYSDHSDSHWQEHITLWEYDGKTIGWSLLNPDWCSFDVYVLPELRSSTAEEYILDWSIDRLTQIVLIQGDLEIQTEWVAEQDMERIRQLEQRGFQSSAKGMWYLEHPLEKRLPLATLPDGYDLRQVAESGDIQPRAAAAYSAIGSTQPFDEYWLRYQRFAESPVYDINMDLVTVSPDGDFSSFCIAWPDPVNHVGLIEPVGTLPDFQSRGLGRAVLTEGLNQLHNCGMNRAAVCVEIDNLVAQDLYHSVGFQKQYQLLTYFKNIA